ncbi:MAG: serine/threonine protein kinase [Planctomycetota bacterium]|nr:MAG: serine/threonine protein kinase [Planctomycetota bacterium]
MEPGELSIRTCRRCAVDVSVPEGYHRPACPRCGGPLEVPSDPEGEVPERTLLELPSEEATAPGGGAPSAPRGWREDDAGLGPAAAAAVGGTQLDLPPSAGTARFLGPYELRRVLGKGGMGVVYEAYHSGLDRTVALKVISGEEASFEEVERFQREARAAARLKHPGIVPIHEVGVLEGRHFFTMELVRGHTLQALARSGTLEPLRAARILVKVARAVQHAHEHKIIHRDLKPSNVIVDADDEPHVMDFGLAKDLSEVSGLTLTGIAMGSPPYMPPEQARGDFKLVDEVSDVYALGATLYECLTGRPPFRGKSLYDVIAKVLVEEPTPPRKLNPEVPYDLETVCLKALEKEKWRRYGSAREFARDLERVVAGETIRAARQGLTTRMGRALERHKLQIFSVLVPLAVVSSLVAYVVGPRPSPPQAVAPKPRRPSQLGPLESAVRALAGGGDHALVRLLSAAAPRPTWEVLAEQAAGLPPGWRLRFASEQAVSGLATDTPTDREVPAEILSSLALAHIDDPQVPNAALSGPLERWLPGQPGLARLLRQVALTLRGCHAHDPDAFRRALAGPPSVLDRAILQAARTSLFPKSGLARAVELCPPGSEKRALVRTAEPPLQYPSGRVRSVEVTRTRWTFPPVLLPKERVPSRAGEERLPRITGLVRPDLDLDASPTPPLRDPSARRVVIGWLRFLYVLDDSDGRILRRRRLPGIAVSLDHHPDGGYRLRVREGKIERVLWARLEEGDALSLREVLPAGGAPQRPVPAVDLLAPGDVARDQLRREACAAAPAFDDLLWVWGYSESAGQPVVREGFHTTPRLGHRLAPGFSQGAFTVCSDRRFGAPGRGAAAVAEVASGSPLRPGDGLLDVRLPAPGEDVLSVVVARTHRRRRNGRVVQEFLPLRLRIPLNRPLPPSEWARVAARCLRRLEREADPNPWLLAFWAVASSCAALPEELPHERWRERLAQLRPEVAGPARARALAAAQSPHLGARERVELGCFLDRAGFEAAADAAFARALEDLAASGSFVPDWAGYGPLDAGRPLARRVEELWREGRGGRALVLTRWRNAFAPVLRESRFALRAYGRFGVRPAEAVVPEGLEVAPPALGGTHPPAKGLAGFGALSLQRFDHALLLQNWFFLSLAGLLFVVFLRYRRHSLRALARIGAEGFAARTRLWLSRPWVRLRYSWPTFITLNDKLSFVVLYLVFFAVFALQDAGLSTLLGERRAPPTVLAGLPADVSGLAWLEERAGESAAPYALAWARAVRGEALPPALEDALEALDRPEARLLLAELRLRAGVPENSMAATLDALEGEDSVAPYARALRARARGDAAALAEIRQVLRERSSRVAVCLATTGQLPALLSPPPTIPERDALVVGADPWWTSMPLFLLRNLFQPWPEAMDASASEFERVWQRDLRLARLRNRWFFLVPAALVLLLSSLFMPTLHPFEPLASDLNPSPLVRLLRLLVPGASQFQRGRPLRGVCLLLPFLYVAHLLWYAATGYRARMEGFETFLSPYEAASIVAENVSALPFVRSQHYLELIGFLLALYVAHWVDLAFARRKDLAARPEVSERIIVPVDSEDLLPGPPAALRSEASTLRDGGAGSAQPLVPPPVGPFDETLREEPRPGGSASLPTPTDPADPDFA